MLHPDMNAGELYTLVITIFPMQLLIEKARRHLLRLMFENHVICKNLVIKLIKFR